MASDSTDLSNQLQNSSSSSSIDFLSLAKTLNFNVHIKLDKNNYIYWKTQILQAIHALDLEGFITRSISLSSKTIDVSITDENDYQGAK
ncbi:hypothetical protein Ddye_027733 [Dipteronia dyeriana]|uniref:Retrotransposon Copia-like N-terminal domain-containing protein n=1 Tax=Dipteronia dyeriana TaxID=168575 RepID=A0AAD9TQH7_9ROSI|nr:hypothetical protein Ddye_027733 [Dipteronia dyeriana]